MQYLCIHFEYFVLFIWGYIPIAVALSFFLLLLLLFYCLCICVMMDSAFGYKIPHQHKHLCHYHHLQLPSPLYTTILPSTARRPLPAAPHWPHHQTTARLFQTFLGVPSSENDRFTAGGALQSCPRYEKQVSVSAMTGHLTRLSWLAWQVCIVMTSTSSFVCSYIIYPGGVAAVTR